MKPNLASVKNITEHLTKISKIDRATANNQNPCVLWFTGLSGSGKSTIADALEQVLYKYEKRTILLDGDNIRKGLNKDLDFTDEDRVENLRRIAEVSKLMLEAGLLTIVSFISPFQKERQMARSLFEECEFIEIYINTPIDICEQRDPKGLYKLARSGKLHNFTGIDSVYEVPQNPEITLHNGNAKIQDMVDQIIQYLTEKQMI